MYHHARDVYKALKKHGVENLFHANTVRTTCSFLRSGGLWSRGAVERAGLDQTEQTSDEDDKAYDVWHDVFVDGVDVHRRSGRENVYGPALIVLALDWLREAGAHPVRVTKSNPIAWRENDVSEKGDFFTSLPELKEGYIFGQFSMSITIRCAYGAIPFGDHTVEVRLDDPERVTGKIDVFSQARGALLASARAGGLSDLSVKTHKCRDDCRCVSRYERTTREELRRLFWP